MLLKELTCFCEDYLRSGEFDDYCPNGLQVEGASQVNKIVTGVTASLELIEAAIEQNADALIVHHGYFWKGESQPIVGFKGRRISALIRNNLSLLAFHLPLDMHPEVGNNVQLARVMDWRVDPVYCAQGNKDIVFTGWLEDSMTIDELTRTIAQELRCEPLKIAAGDHRVSKIAWCTGAAQGYIDQAVAKGAQVFISGEVSEHTFHYAREMGIHYIAAGHHATERFGVQALGEHISDRFDIECVFIDIPNPV